MNKKERNASDKARRDALKEAGLIKLEVWIKSTNKAAIAQVKGLDQRHTIRKDKNDT
jgi:hypothetical protein